MQVFVGTSAKEGTIRNIKAISHNKEKLFITVDGDRIEYKEGLRCAGIYPVTGATDSINSPSGVTNQDSHVASFRYRYIENPWGGLWEVLDGLKLRNGTFYISRDFNETNIEKWNELSFSAPMIRASDHSENNWIMNVDFDEDYAAIILPETLTNDKGRYVDILTDRGDLDNM